MEQQACSLGASLQWWARLCALGWLCCAFCPPSPWAPRPSVLHFDTPESPCCWRLSKLAYPVSHAHLTVTGAFLKEPLSRVSERSGQPVTRKVFRRDLEGPLYRSGWEAHLVWTAHSVPLSLWVEGKTTSTCVPGGRYLSLRSSLATAGCPQCQSITEMKQAGGDEVSESSHGPAGLEGGMSLGLESKTLGCGHLGPF